MLPTHQALPGLGHIILYDLFEKLAHEHVIGGQEETFDSKVQRTLGQKPDVSTTKYIIGQYLDSFEPGCPRPGLSR